MSKILKYIERILQVLAVIGCIWTVVEYIQMHTYKTKLKNKADEYLDEELELEGNIGGPIAVYSPTLKEKEKRVAKIAIVTGIRAVVSLVLNLINSDY